MATKMKYCKPPHSTDSEFKIFFQCTGVASEKINKDCDIGDSWIETAPDYDIEMFDEVVHLVASKPIDCFQCMDWDVNYLIYEVYKDLKLTLYCRNAVPGWEYKGNVVLTYKHLLNYSTGASDTGECLGYMDNSEIGEEIHPVVFTPEKADEKICDIFIGHLEGKELTIKWEYVAC